ncbi:MAG: sporulation transcriptional regulator SpoIIID [Clostridia bacterium]|nr:sporulation transcriptional regulator SpoIIID [Clostridia bacterium]
MIGSNRERSIMLGEYITENQATVRSTAAHFQISKSTVHKDVTERLYHEDRQLFRRVREVLEQNKAERHLRGGEATKQKYLHQKPSP